MTQALDRDELMEMTYAEIRAGYAAIFGEPSRSPNKVWMVNKMVEASARRAAPGATAPTPPPTSSDTPTAEAPTTGVATGASAVEERVDALVVEMPQVVAEQPDVTLALAGGAEAPEQGVASVDSIPSEAETAVPCVAAEAPVDGTPGATSDVRTVALSEAVGEVVPEDAPVSERQPETEPMPLSINTVAVPVAPESGARAVDIAGHAEVSTPASGTVSNAGTKPKERGRYRDMTVEELRRAYELTVGRPTSSVDVSYLRWKIIQAEKGVVPVGPIPPGHRREGARKDEEKTLPLTIPAAAVIALDEGWARQGFRSRMAFLRTAIREALLKRGEDASAGHFPDATAGSS